VTVTTKHLKDRLQIGKYPLNKNIRIIPNALDMRMFPYRMEGPRNKVILWRGSKTHHRDVMSYSQQIIEASNDPKHATWLWHFIGDNLWFCTDYMPQKNVTWAKGIDPIDYMKHIHDIRPAAIQIPLHDSVFNRSKSNIAWIEGTFAGAVAIAPDWEQWKMPGVLTYQNQAEYKDILRAVLDGEIDIAAKVSESWKYIQTNLNLRKWAQERLDIIDGLIGGIK
jgi:hypothetical protein